MVQKHANASDHIDEPRKKKRVEFTLSDDGTEATECIRIHFVSCVEEVGASDSSWISPVDLSSFFNDGKIHGYKDLKIGVWISSLSFHAYSDIRFHSKQDGGKGITDVKLALQKIFGHMLVEDRDDFVQTFSSDGYFARTIISNGQIIQSEVPNHQASYINGVADIVTPDMKIVRLSMGHDTTAQIYNRLVHLILLFIDGSNPIDVTDPDWDLYLLIKNKTIEEDSQPLLIGFMAVYRFYHYPDSIRLRLSQILVLPPYRHRGYGRYLVQTLNKVAMEDNIYDLTVEEPLNYFQYIRTSIDIQRLLDYAPVKNAVRTAASHIKNPGKDLPNLVFPHKDLIESVRKDMRINKKQFFWCWEILLFLALDPIADHAEQFVSVILFRIRSEVVDKDLKHGGKKIIDVPSDYNPDMSFVMFRCGKGEKIVETEEEQKNRENQLMELVEDRVKEIETIATKVRNVCVVCDD